MQFEYDPERLIQEVRKRPGIWDFNHRDYRNKIIRHELWMEIVNELMHTDVKLTKSDMRELELQLQKKWKSIRDCFQKYIMNPNRTKRPYIYTKQLQFLIKDADEAPVEAGESDHEERPKIKRKKTWKSKRTLTLVDETTDDDEDNDNDFETHDDSNYSNDVIATVTPSSIKDSQPKIPSEFAFASVDVPAKIDREDPDKMFLLSLLPHLKSIPEDYRLHIKMELMQVLQNANYNVVRDQKLI